MRAFWIWLFVCMTGATSAAFADSCDSVIEIRPGDYISAFGNTPGTQVDQLKYFMRRLTAEQLDSALSVTRCNGNVGFIQVPSMDQIGSLAVHGVCPQVQRALKCYQTLGWPISRNPRRIASKSVEPAAPVPETFESVRTKGGAAIMDFAAEKGCLSAATVRIDECRKYSAAAVPDMWRTLKCEQSPGQENCRSLLKLNDNLGPYRLALPGAQAVAQAGATKPTTEPGPKPASADKCLTVDAEHKPCVSVVSKFAVPGQATPGLIFYKIKFRMSDSCQGARLVRATTSSGQKLETGISPGSETELVCSNQGQNACSGLADPSSSCH
jgi:hypothetical protein